MNERIYLNAELSRGYENEDASDGRDLWPIHQPLEDGQHKSGRFTRPDDKVQSKSIKIQSI